MRRILGALVVAALMVAAMALLVPSVLGDETCLLNVWVNSNCLWDPDDDGVWAASGAVTVRNNGLEAISGEVSCEIVTPEVVGTVTPMTATFSLGPGESSTSSFGLKVSSAPNHTDPVAITCHTDAGGGASGQASADWCNYTATTVIDVKVSYARRPWVLPVGFVAALVPGVVALMLWRRRR